MIRKLFYGLVCMSILLPHYFVWATLEEPYMWEEDSVAVASIIENKVDLKLYSESAILLDEDSGIILYTKNEHEKLRPASVTKVMTILLIMEALERGDIHLTDEVPCSERASKMGGSQIWLDQTERLTVQEMLKAICVVSANDCCVAMAEFLAGNEERFVQRMNQRAKELGMNDTTFRNCHGIDEDGHLTSAYDIGLMSRELSKNYPQIHDYSTIWMDTLRDGKSELVNTNKLVRYYAGCTGLKTGSTSLALFNLSATASRNNLNLIAVVMKGPTSQQRFDDAKALLDYGFANFENHVVVRKGEKVVNIAIEKAKQPSMDVVAKEDCKILLKKGEAKNLSTQIIWKGDLKAPLEYLEDVGTLECYLGDNVLSSISLQASEKVEAKGWFDYWKELLHSSK